MLTRLSKIAGLLTSKRFYQNLWYYSAAKPGNTGSVVRGSTTQSPNIPILADRNRVNSRIRHLERNNPVIAGGIRNFVNLIVNTGIWPEPIIANASGDREPFNDLNNMIERLFKMAAKGHLDYDGNASFALTWNEQIRMICKAFTVPGEIFVVMHKRRTDPRLPRLQLELVESERLGTGLYATASGVDGRRDGITYGADGRPVSYTFKRSLEIDGSWSFDTYPARDVIHVMLPERPQQGVGDLMLSSVLAAADALSQYVEHEIQTKSMMAKVAGVMEGASDLGSSFGNQTGSDGEPLREIFTPEASIWQITNGDKFHELSMTRPGAQFPDFIYVIQQFIASGMGLPVSILTGDVSRSNFAAYKMEMINHLPQINRYQDALCNAVTRIYTRFVYQAIEDRIIPLSMLPADMIDVTEHKVRRPGFHHMDRAKEVSADMADVRGGFNSPQRICAFRGNDAYEVADEIAEMQEYYKRKGVNIDYSNGGSATAAAAAREGNETPSETSNQNED
jgi:lambda family phage portal protein